MAAKKKAATKKRGNTNREIELDFKDTESREGKKRKGGRAHYPEGDYAAKILSTELGKSPEKGTPQVTVEFQFTQGKLKGKKISDQWYLTSGALWRVRSLLEACGLKVPNKAVKINFTKLEGKELAITLSDEEYDEKVTSRITDTFLLSELDDTEEDVELEDDEDEDEDDDDDEDDDEDEDDEDDDEDDEDDEDADEDDDLESIDLDEV